MPSPRTQERNHCVTTHRLDFEVTAYTPKYDDGYPWEEYRIGSCHGLWCAKDRIYNILSIINREPHNGHLEDVFEWFMHSCRRDGYPLLVHEVSNPALARSLLRRGFTPVFGTDNFIWLP